MRDIYPGAWAGEAPGKRLRRGAAVAPPVSVAAAPAFVPAPSPGPGPGPELLAKMPTLSAAPDPAPAAAPFVLELVPEPAPPPAAAAPVVAPPVAKPAAAVAAPAAPVSVPPKTAARASSTNGAKRAPAVPFDQRSNVREVLSSLDETARRPAAPVTPAGPVVRQPGVLPESQVLAPARGEARRSAEYHQYSGRLLDSAAMVRAAHRSGQSAATRDFRCLYPVHGGGQPRGTALVRSAPGLLHRRQFSQAGRPIRAFGVLLRRGRSRQPQGA